MGMEIEKRFVVKAPADAVWDFLTDPTKVARCLPGAAITERLDDRTYAGTMTVKVGPVVAAYRGKLRFERLDAEAREAELSASGQETRGKGGADMRMRSRVDPKGEDETEVTVVSDVNVVGVLAQFGRGMIQDVSDQLFQKFTAAMSHELEAPAAPVSTEAEAAAPPPSPAPASEAAPATPQPGAAAAALGAAQAAAAGAPPVAPAAVPPVLTTTTPPPAVALPAPVPAAPPPPRATEDVLDVGALGAAAAGRAAARTLRRPVFWVAALALVVLLYWLLHH